MNGPSTAGAESRNLNPLGHRTLPLLWSFALIVASSGCGRPAPSAADRIPPNPNAPALYSNVPPPSASPAAPARPPSTNTAWKAAPFYVLHTEVSPATLVHSSTRYLGLFCDLLEFGLGAPAHVAWATKDGPRTFPFGQTHDVSGMEENWLLVWFADATNWTNWDSPWAIFLQHKASWLRLDQRGLHLEFPREAGDVVLMPLYGYYKPPPAGRDYLAEHGLPSKKLKTWEWEKGLARDPLTRLRFWAGATREFPIHCEETFTVDRSRDSVTFRSRFTWHSIADDWGTRHVKLAPISPTLGLAVRDKEFPAKFSKPFFDMELPTSFGPYLCVQDVDSFDATISVLQYVHETQIAPGTNAADLARADLESSWAAFGASAEPAMFSAPAAWLSAARNGWRDGSLETYHQAAAQFARAIVQLWAKQRGADWLRKQQPWHSTNWLDGELFLTRLRHDTGWSFSGPRVPPDAPEADFTLRWRHAHDPDVARFCREYLNDDIRREINWLQHLPKPPLDAAEFAKLRALFPDEPGDVARTRLQRLIPGGPPSPFGVGMDRDAAGPNTTLVTRLELCATGVTPRGPQWCWPQLTWPAWKTPTGAPWSFGRIKPVRDGSPVSVQRVPLNWNTEVLTFALP